MLSLGIATTGVVTFAYFGVAGHVLDDDEYGRVSLLWSLLFVIMCVIYRPVEQLLSRTISDRDVRGHTGHEHLRVAITIQLSMAVVFLVAALTKAPRPPPATAGSRCAAAPASRPPCSSSWPPSRRCSTGRS